MERISGIQFQVQTLDSQDARTYMRAIPFHRLTGGAAMRAPFFHWSGSTL